MNWHIEGALCALTIADEMRCQFDDLRGNQNKIMASTLVLTVSVTRFSGNNDQNISVAIVTLSTVRYIDCQCNDNAGHSFRKGEPVLCDNDSKSSNQRRVMTDVIISRTGRQSILSLDEYKFKKAI